MTSRVDVIVLGGGVMGTSLSYHLGHDHGQSVALFEKGTLGQGASSKAAGIVSAQCWNRWDVEVVEESRVEYLRLSEAHQGDLYEEVGGTRAASTQANVGLLEQQRKRLVQSGVVGRMVSPTALRELFPAGDFEGVTAALYTPHDAVVQPADLTNLYGRLAGECGASLISGFDALHMERKDGLWHVGAAGQEFVAKTLTVACGAWSKKTLALLGYRAPLAPYLTRACLLKAGLKGGFPFYHDSERDVYLRPFPGEDLLLGDGTELTEVDPDRMGQPDDLTFLENIHSFLSTRFPAWAGSAVESSWWGVCTSTPDRRPLVGPVKGHPGLFVATGFNGYGIMRAGGVARRLSDALSTGKWGELDPCAPARFPEDFPAFEPKPGFTLD
jgi:sarcosine oxidase subunit beta